MDLKIDEFHTHQQSRNTAIKFLDLLRLKAMFRGFFTSHMFCISNFCSFLISFFIIVVINMILLDLRVVMSG